MVKTRSEAANSSTNSENHQSSALPQAATNSNRKVKRQFKLVEQDLEKLMEAMTSERQEILIRRERLTADMKKLETLVENENDEEIYDQFDEVTLKYADLDAQAEIKLRTPSESAAPAPVTTTETRQPTMPENGNYAVSSENFMMTSNNPVISSRDTEYTIQLPSATNPSSSSLINALPKINMDYFNGNPLQWPDWERKFSFLIDQLDISNNQKIAYLQGLVTGKARDAIKHYSCNGDLYVEAMNTLKRKFGQPETIVHHYLDKLHDLKPLTNGRPDTYLEFASFLNGLVTAFKELRFNEDLGSTSKLRAVTSKLSYSEHLRWQQHLISKKIDRPDLVAFNDWFQSNALAYERIQMQSSPQQPKQHHTQPHQLNIRAAQATSNQDRPQRDNQCPLNDGYHPLFRCQTFLNKNPKERQAIVKESGRCFNCLKEGHSVKFCPSTSNCMEPGCYARHNTLLHTTQRKPPPRTYQNANVTQREFTDTRNIQTHQNYANTSTNTDILLQVLPVVLYNGRMSIETYAFIDTGSDFSILLEESAEKLKLRTTTSEPLTLSGINQVSHTFTKTADLEIAPLDRHKRFNLNGVNILKHANMPRLKYHPGNVVNQYPHLKNISIPTLENAKVTVLLGLDVLDLTFPQTSIKGPTGSPYASKCSLGWSRFGHHRQGHLPIDRLQSYFCQTCVNSDIQLTEQIYDWYQMESLGQRKSLRSPDKEKALDILEKSYKKLPDGRIELGMLWNTNKPMPNNRSLAEKHLNWTVNRMSKDQKTFELYDDGISTDLKKGFIREIPYDENKDEGWLIPHHGVVNPNKPGKIRRVLNAASVYQGVSLNDCLLTGPDLIGDLLGILLRFRENPVAVMADIEAMFMQVAFKPDERKSLRFLWKKSSKDPVKLYEYMRHIFGKKDSPVIACYALLRAINDYVCQYPQLEGIAENQTYMDDYSDSLESDSRAISVSRTLVEVLTKSPFNLTKWASNSRTFLEAMPKESLAKPIDQLFHPDNAERVLGAFWRISSDTILFKTPTRLSLPQKITQRTALSFVSSLFDPLGLASPVVIRIKILLQTIWKDGQDWDKEVDKDKAEKVRTWANSLKDLQPLEIPRLYTKHRTNEIQLHVFSDASLEATAVVAYFRFVAPEGKSAVTFVLGKTRVAPIKQQTVPKLELQAAFYAVRLRKTILEKTRFNVHKVYHWTDSNAVLGWVRNTKERHKMFIANRVGEILEESRRNEWNHISGVDNPADDGTRGIPVENVNSSCRWLRGPSFLRDEAEWPSQPNQETQKTCTFAQTRHISQLDVNYDNFSTWQKLMKVTKIALKFAYALQHKRFTPHELHEKATTLLLCQSNRESFSKEFQALTDNKPVSPRSRIVNYSPFLDDNGQLKSASRLQNAPVSIETRTPLILNANHKIVRLCLEAQHKTLLHVGVEQMRNYLQQKFRIIGLRTILRSIVHNCFDCRRQKALNSQPKMADLPASRFSAQPVAFKTTGVDFFGPFSIHVGRKTEKRYICQFTCFVVRAVHLEICENLSTESFLFALRRFMLDEVVQKSSIATTVPIFKEHGRQ